MSSFNRKRGRKREFNDAYHKYQRKVVLEYYHKNKEKVMLQRRKIARKKAREAKKLLKENISQ